MFSLGYTSFEKLLVKGKITLHNICPKVDAERITKPLSVIM